MEQGQAARAQERVEVRERNKEEGKDAAAALAPDPAETVFARSVAKGFLINWERPVLSKSAQNAGKLWHEHRDLCLKFCDFARKRSEKILKEAVRAAGLTKVVCAGDSSDDVEVFLKKLHGQI